MQHRGRPKPRILLFPVSPPWMLPLPGKDRSEEDEDGGAPPGTSNPLWIFICLGVSFHSKVRLVTRAHFSHSLALWILWVTNRQRHTVRRAHTSLDLWSELGATNYVDLSSLSIRSIQLSAAAATPELMFKTPTTFTSREFTMGIYGSSDVPSSLKYVGLVVQCSQWGHINTLF